MLNTEYSTQTKHWFFSSFYLPARRVRLLNSTKFVQLVWKHSDCLGFVTFRSSAALIVGLANKKLADLQLPSWKTCEADHCLFIFKLCCFKTYLFTKFFCRFAVRLNLRPVLGLWIASNRPLLRVPLGHFTQSCTTIASLQQLTQQTGNGWGNQLCAQRVGDYLLVTVTSAQQHLAVTSMPSNKRLPKTVGSPDAPELYVWALWSDDRGQRDFQCRFSALIQYDHQISSGRQAGNAKLLASPN